LKLRNFDIVDQVEDF